MSYKALLFCPDEKTARVVTQVLSELEFTVEIAGEPFATVKKLTDEHFDALVVDCENEQNASLLFKGARNSTLNHSSLYVAVVEGQTGVAKAFRIGANLVLTKPINIEQSKSTLRVARGLLRKNEARAAVAGAASPAMRTEPAPAKRISVPLSVPSTTPLTPVVTPAVPAPAAPAASFAMLEVEQEPTPATEAAEVALLESMPDTVAGRPAAAESHWAPNSGSAAEPIAASTAGQATAAAPALAKTTELRTAAPLASQDAIVNGAVVPEHFEAASVPVPTFGTYAQARSEPGSGRLLFRRVATLLIFGAAGYFAWTRLDLGQTWSALLSYLPGVSVQTQTASKAPAPSVPATEAPAQIRVAPETNTAAPLADSSKPANNSAQASQHPTAPEIIEVNEVPITSEPRATVTPKPQPLVVKTRTGNASTQNLAPQPAPPSIAIAGANNADAAMASIVSSNVTLPKAGAAFPVSQGVSQGLLIRKVAPVYSPVALQLRKEGAVELSAIVSKEGLISGIKVVSGDAVLAKSALDAVRQWRYRPYLLNGVPVEIETQITINFRLPR